MRAPYTNVNPEHPMLYKEDVNAEMWVIQPGGHYFDTIEEALEYMRTHFGGYAPSLRYQARGEDD